MKLDVNSLIQMAAKVSDALVGDNDITIRHAGLVAKAPYEGNESLTVLQVLRQFGGGIGIAGNAMPTVEVPGQGPVAGSDKCAAGATYEVYTDKKENATS